MIASNALLPLLHHRSCNFVTPMRSSGLTTWACTSKHRLRIIIHQRGANASHAGSGAVWTPHSLISHWARGHVCIVRTRSTFPKRSSGIWSVFNEALIQFAGAILRRNVWILSTNERKRQMSETTDVPLSHDSVWEWRRYNTSMTGQTYVGQILLPGVLSWGGNIELLKWNSDWDQSD